MAFRRSVGSLQATRTMGAALGPAVGGVLFDALGFRPTFLIAAGICALGFVLVSVAYREIPAVSGDDKEDRRTLSFRELLSVPGVFTIIALLFFANMVARSFSLVLPLFLEELAGSAAALGALSGAAFSLGAFADTSSSLGLGRLSGRGRPRLWVLASLVLGALALFAMANVVESAWSLVFLRAVYGFVAGGLATATYTLASGSISQRSRATAYGILSGAAMLGASLGPLTSGFLAPLLGFRGLLGMGAGIFLVLALVLSINAIRRPPLRVPEEREMPYVPLPR
jgi:MFS family permease